MADGTNMLQSLSSENFIKRVPQNAVIVKPNSKSSIRLDELNRLLTEAGRGEAATKRLDQMDAELGMNNDPTKTNISRNKAKNSPTVDIQYGDDDSESAMVPSVTVTEPAAPSQTDLMMQMMQTMQQMQKELAEMKKPATKKPAAVKVTKTKNVAAG